MRETLRRLRAELEARFARLTQRERVMVSAAGPSTTDKAPVRIKKCQDAQGKWHYGDDAADACARSKVIELDQRGIKRKETAAPLTEAQLKERESKRAAEEEQKRLETEQQQRDQQLLTTYTHEDDIKHMSTRKVGEIETQIKFAEEAIKSLRGSLARLQSQAAQEQRTGQKVSPQTAKAIANNEAQIARHETNIQKMRKEQETLRVKYQADLERFREVKRKQAMPPPLPAATGTPAPAKP